LRRGTVGLSAWDKEEVEKEASQVPEGQQRCQPALEEALSDAVGGPADAKRIVQFSAPSSSSCAAPGSVPAAADRSVAMAAEQAVTATRTVG